MSGKIFSHSRKRNTQNIYVRAKTCKNKRRSTYYFTTGRQITEEGLKEMEDEVLNPYEGGVGLKSMSDVKKYWENKKNKKIKEREADYTNHHTFRSRVNLRWKLERLFVPDEEELPGPSMTENVDPNFFKIVSGRPIKQKKSTREYLKDIRDCFLTRLQIGYCFDEILLMDERHINEKQRLDQARKGFLTALKGFEAFLKEDHVSSSSLLESSKENERKSKEKLEMINSLKEELRNLQADVSLVQEEWRNLRMFQKFLYRISPTEWRKAHDPYYGKEEGGVLASDSCLFDRDFSDGEKTELDVRTSQFEEDFKRSPPPALYFTDPQEIMRIFAELEKNNLRALMQCKSLDFPAEEMTGELTQRKIIFDQEEKVLREEVKYLKNLVEEEEKSFQENESKMKEVAFGLFRELITNEEYLCVSSLVEDAYEDATSLSDSSSDLVTMIKDIELEYESLLLALDMSPTDIMTRTTRQFYRTQKRELREAKEADKKVRQMEMLLKRLSKSLSYPKKEARERKIVPRSLPPEELMFKFKLPKIPSKEQRDHMFFFGKASDKVRLYRPLCL